MATTRKNLLTSRDVYNAYYGDFRGVDFSSDHTQVHKQRLAYAVNMFKDYQSGQGQALETIAGFRRRLELPEAPVVHGIHRFQHRGEGGTILTKVLVHAGEKLYLWHNYPNSINVVMKETITLPAETSVINGTRTFKLILGDNVAGVRDITKPDGESGLLNMDYFNPSTHELSVSRSDLVAGDNLYLSFVEGVITKEDALFVGMNARRSASFIFNNRLYLIDGKNYLVYDGKTVKSVCDSAYIRRPTSTSYRAEKMPTAEQSTSRGTSYSRSSSIPSARTARPQSST